MSKRVSLFRQALIEDAEKDARIAELEAEVTRLKEKRELAQVDCKGCGANIITTHCYECMDADNIKLQEQLEAVRDCYVVGNATQTHINMFKLLGEGDEQRTDS